jgi:hypothetical protein
MAAPEGTDINELVPQAQTFIDLQTEVRAKGSYIFPHRHRN